MIAGLRRNAYLLLSTLLLISAGGIPAASAEAPQTICQRLIDSAELMTVDKEYAESFALLTKAETLAKNEGLDYLLADIHVKAGHNYYDMFDYGEALAQFMEAYQIAIQTSNIPAEIRILTKISLPLQGSEILRSGRRVSPEIVRSRHQEPRSDAHRMGCRQFCGFSDRQRAL